MLFNSCRLSRLTKICFNHKIIHQPIGYIIWVSEHSLPFLKINFGKIYYLHNIVKYKIEYSFIT